MLHCGTNRARQAIALLVVCSVGALASEDPAEETVEETEAEAVDSADTSELSDIESILSNPLGEDDYRETRSCIWNRQIDTIDIIDENFVVFKGHGRGKIWVNRLAHSCVGLRRDMVVITESRSGSVCDMGTIRARPRSSSPFAVPVRCWLGKFEAIDEQQLEALKRAIEERDKASKAPTDTP